MHGVTRSLCTFEDIRTENGSTEGTRRLRLTLQDQNQPNWTQEQHRRKPIGRAFALVQPANDGETLSSEPIKPGEEKVEVIKVYLEARKQDQEQHDRNIKMLSDEVSHIQEVRYCLKNLRQQMEARNSGKNGQYKTNGYRVPQPSSQSSVSNCAVGGAAPQTKEWEEGVLSERESDQMRELTRRLYGQFQTKLQEAEHRHQEERARLEVESSEMRQQLCQQGESLQQAEEELGERDARIGELSRLLSGMEVEQRTLLERMRESEGELQQLRTLRDEGRAKEERSEELEKELAILKEKIHHLDDMLKCQQRKVRHMIEQLQNSRTVIQERDRVIRELQEKVAFLEAENREMHDQMDHFLSHRRAAPSTSERNSKIVYSKPLTPSSTSKTLPFIKVIEIKS